MKSNFFFLSLFINCLLFILSSCIPLPSYNGNPKNMDTQIFLENIIIPQSVLDCAHPKYQPDTQGVWNFEQLADAFFEFGVLPWNFPNPGNRKEHIDECVAALIIASGECEPVEGRAGCSAAGSGQSGVWQTDFLRTIPGFPTSPIMNLCTSAYGTGYMAAPFFAATGGYTNTLSFENNAPASIYNCYGADVEDNFIGPFCHTAGASRWSYCKTCRIFNGQPFPSYYLNKADKQDGQKFRTICESVALDQEDNAIA